MSMETQLNWARLYEQGRCKAIGVPWSNEELKALTLGIPAEYVRIGILDKEAFAVRVQLDDAEAKKSGEQPLIRRDREELLMLAHKLDIPATSAAGKETLITLIEQKQGKPVAGASVKKSRKGKTDAK